MSPIVLLFVVELLFFFIILLMPHFLITISHLIAIYRWNSMPVFFFIDPEIVNDGQLARVNNITLSYTFFQTDLDDDDDDDDGDDEDDDMDEEAQVGNVGASNEKATGNTNGGSQRSWTNKLAFWRR